MKAYRILPVSLLCLATVPVIAATFIVPPDQALIDRSDAIVIGVVQTSNARLTEAGGVETFTEILASEVLKGDQITPGAIITLREPGGRTDTLSLELHGVPRYEPGQRVLVMLSPDKRPGMWRTHEYALGKFQFIKDDFGREYLVRDRDNVCGCSLYGWKSGVRARKSAEFIDYVTAVTHRKARRR